VEGVSHGANLDDVHCVDISRRVLSLRWFDSF
jgi:hypothetical protein